MKSLTVILAFRNEELVLFSYFLDSQEGGFLWNLSGPLPRINECQLGSLRVKEVDSTY